MSWKIIVYALLIFAAGVLTGVLASPHLARAFMRPPTPAEMSQHLLKRFQSELSITAEQTAQIKPLIEQTSSDLEAVRVSTSKQISTRIDENNSRIEEFLTPEQKIKFKQMEEERRKRFGRHRPPPP
jgi:Spy/CpxP family protein refolding chaperone